LKNSQVIQAVFVSRSHHLLRAKTGFQAARASTGTIQKSSSQGKISPKLFCTKLTKSSQYCGQAKITLSFLINFSNSHL